MPSTIQIRNAPEDLHRKPTASAAFAGKSLSDYLPSKIRALADRPTRRADRTLRRLPPIDLGLDPVDIIRDCRDRERS